MPRFAKNLGLLLASLFFYAWGEHGYVLLMLGSIICNFVFGQLIDTVEDRSRRQKVLIFAIIVNLLPLVYFKYSHFFLQNIILLLGQLSFSISYQATAHHLPIGISFFTFQALSYLIDVYRRTDSAQKNIINMGLYISFFPQLIAGPIVRYKDIAFALQNRVVSLDNFSKGSERFVFGLAKKVLLANPMGAMADTIFAISSCDISTPVAWIGIVCYSFQIYYDFSGYSDMAIGLGRIFGFRYLENFNYPYISRSMQEFWKRWHISLSNWFKDYIYIPLGGNRRGELRVILNLLLVFLLCGLWHGASWNFIIWGGLHGFFLVLERGTFGRMIKRAPRVIQSLYVFLVVVTTWTFFRIETVSSALSFLGSLFFGGDTVLFNPHVALEFTFSFCVIFLLAMFFSTPIYPLFRKYMEKDVVEFSCFDGKWVTYAVLRVSIFCCLFLLSAMNLANGSYNPFIYFRF